MILLDGKKTSNDIKDEIDSMDEPKILSREENVVKVDFGKKQ